MNITFKTTALALVLGLSFSVNAQEYSDNSVIDTQNYSAKIVTSPTSNKLTVYVGNASQKNLILSMKNEKGNCLYKKIIGPNQPQGIARLNFDELPDGIYQLVLSDSYSNTIRTFRKETEVIIAKPLQTLIVVN